MRKWSYTLSFFDFGGHSLQEGRTCGHVDTGLRLMTVDFKFKASMSNYLSSPQLLSESYYIFPRADSKVLYVHF